MPFNGTVFFEEDVIFSGKKAAFACTLNSSDGQRAENCRATRGAEAEA